jgi:hypothetical protein
MDIRKNLFHYVVGIFISVSSILLGVICTLSYMLGINRFLAAMILLVFFSLLFGCLIDEEGQYIKNTTQFLLILIIISSILSIVIVKITHKIFSHQEVFNNFNDFFVFLWDKQVNIESLKSYKFFYFLFSNLRKFLS